eukprot:Transcript_931.p2 GENE.Transcript_931~~Transcript_931.p2  ORF type:complete len:347 (-),score=103.15 Transcript_931:291-1331(-)
MFGNGPKGSWFVDPVLVARGAPDAAAPLSGRAPTVRAPPPDVRVRVERGPGEGAHRFVTTASASLDAAGGELRAADGSFNVAASLRSELHATNDNALGPVVSVAAGTMRASHTRQVREVGNGGGGASWTWESSADYPYSVWNAMAQDAASFQLEGNVSYGSQRSEAWAGGAAPAAAGGRSQPSQPPQPQPPPQLPPWWLLHPSLAAVPPAGLCFKGGCRGGAGEEERRAGRELRWSVHADSRAAYNRSTGPDRTPHVERGGAVQAFDAAKACVARRATARNGSVSGRADADACPHAPARTALCRAFDECSAPSRPAVKTRALPTERSRPVPVRRPWRDAAANVWVL